MAVQTPQTHTLEPIAPPQPDAPYRGADFTYHLYQTRSGCELARGPTPVSDSVAVLSE